MRNPRTGEDVSVGTIHCQRCDVTDDLGPDPDRAADIVSAHMLRHRHDNRRFAQ